MSPHVIACRHTSPSDLILEREVTCHHMSSHVITRITIGPHPRARGDTSPHINIHHHYHIVGPHPRGRYDTSPHVNIRHHMSSRRTSSSGARGAWLAARCFYFSTYRPPSAKCDAPTIGPPKKDNNNNKNFSTSPREARRRRARARTRLPRVTRARTSHTAVGTSPPRETHTDTHTAACVTPP